MTIFSLHNAVLADYRDFVRSFFLIAEPRTQEFVDRSLVEEGRISCCKLAHPTLTGRAADCGFWCLTNCTRIEAGKVRMSPC